MKLKEFRVGPFRNIIDSGTVQADPQITVLVGKNESGKTNVVHALHALNPANQRRTEFSRLDYPRWLQKSDRRSGEYEKSMPVEAWFDLEDSDSAAVEEVFGEGVLERCATFRVCHHYDKKYFQHYLPDCDESQAIKNTIDGHDIGPFSTLKELHQYLDGASQERTSEDSPSPMAAVAIEIKKRATHRFGEHSSVSQAVGQLLRERVPQFFYFDDHAMLPGTSNIEELLAEDAQLEPSQQTALQFLQMGDAEDEDLTDENYENRKAELQAIAADLTDDVLKYWRQNPSLRLNIDVDKRIERQRNGEQLVRHDLKLDVLDTRHHFTNSLDARSSGFRWFISFIASFAEFETCKNVIVLLDEPGLGLHGRAQADFLRFINERVADRHQVVFTTHSPFMVDPARLDRVRVVEDTGPKTGTKVTTTDDMTKDPDTVFPLQAALGYDIAQNLFIGPDNLVVEGLSDFTYLTILSDHLKSLDRAALDDRWRVLPAGGATNIPTFVSLLGPALDITVLADGAEGRGQKLGGFVKSGVLSAKRLVTPDTAAGVKDADIEDLFDPDDYLTLYNAAFGSSLTKSKVKGTDRIVKRIERALGASFDHNKPARYLLRNRDKLDTFSEGTLAAFEALFAEINKTLKPK